MARTRIKICGITEEDSALAAAECGADALGFVFFKGSARYIEPARAWEIVSMLPPFVHTVGLFVNPKPDQVDDVRQSCPFDMTQLHGNEPEPVVRACMPPLIKAVKFDPATIEHELRKWSLVEEVMAVLVDGSSGGEGVAFDWSALAAVRDACEHPLIIAGGLTPENVGEAIRVVRPWAVDVSSGVERAKGVKDVGLIAEFCEAVRDVDAELEEEGA
ncbi:MAG: phosphoribosylanthranilate isomerase [Phycisphaerales bacterium]